MSFPKLCQPLETLVQQKLLRLSDSIGESNGLEVRGQLLILDTPNRKYWYLVRHCPVCGLEIEYSEEAGSKPSGCNLRFESPAPEATETNLGADHDH